MRHVQTKLGLGLEGVAAEIMKCRRCRLCEGRTRAVPGEGDPNADVVILGEAPGKNEDLSGRPFVGRAGKLLDEVLAEVGYSREKVFIANIVKCRPPENRRPKADEIEACRPYLDAQLEMLKPKVIVLLGNTALGAMLGLGKITRLRGKPIERDGRTYLPTYHPAAIVRNRNKRGELVEDLGKLRELV